MKHRRQQARSPENIAGIQHVCIGAHSHGGDMPYGKRFGLQHGRLVNGQLAMSGNPPISRREIGQDTALLLWASVPCRQARALVANETDDRLRH